MATVTFSDTKKKIPVTRPGQLFYNPRIDVVAISTYVDASSDKVKAICLNSINGSEAAIHSNLLVEWQLKDCYLYEGEVKIKN